MTIEDIIFLDQRRSQGKYECCSCGKLGRFVEDYLKSSQPRPRIRHERLKPSHQTRLGMISGEEVKHRRDSCKH